MKTSVKSNICIVCSKIHFNTGNESLLQKLKISLEEPIRCIRTFIWFQKRSWKSLVGKEAIMGMEDDIFYPRRIRVLGIHITKLPFSETDTIKTQ